MHASHSVMPALCFRQGQRNSTPFSSATLPPRTSTNSALISSGHAHPRAIDGHLQPRPAVQSESEEAARFFYPSPFVPSLYPCPSICRGHGPDHHRRAEGRPEYGVYGVVRGSGPRDEPGRIGFKYGSHMYLSVVLNKLGVSFIQVPCCN